MSFHIKKGINISTKTLQQAINTNKKNNEELSNEIDIINQDKIKSITNENSKLKLHIKILEKKIKNFEENKT